MSNEVGVLIRRLGVIGTIFLPLNLVAGIKYIKNRGESRRGEKEINESIQVFLE